MDELKKKRTRWVEANRENGFEEGILRLLTDLYPDNAHFIYELLQNAEDAHASTVRFTLSETGVEFEHDGERLFSISDVDSITSIGVSTKRDDPTSIGKFGVGFKAVFAYTATPEIHSGKFHFRIIDLVVPEPKGIPTPCIGANETRFIFPFNHPRKTSARAVAEIEHGLRALSANTLLFLSHIRKIEYLLTDSSLGSLERFDHDGGRIEIRACHPGGGDSISHWLRFHKNVDVIDEDEKLKNCRIAIAYSLIEEIEEKKKSTIWKVIPLDRGQVSIYFPADKETSNLRFHIHAPFASTVARDSVRDCKANDQLRDHIANLLAESFAVIRDQGLMTVSFLAALPIPQDNLPQFYRPIRQVIVEKFRNEPLTPMKNGKHAEADGIVRGPADISRVINDDDLVLLLGDDYVSPMWVANPPLQSQREIYFLDSLNIDEWGWDDLVKSIKYLNAQEIERVEEWISKKDDVWLMRYYALLGEACTSHGQFVKTGHLRIVRVETEQGDKHVAADKAFFPPDEGIIPPPDIYFVKPSTYNKGRSEMQKKYATSFLDHIGVRPFDAKAAIKLRLAHFDKAPQKGPAYYINLNQFFSYWKANPDDSDIFIGHTFLLSAPDENGDQIWTAPEQLCLDTPYLDTGLAEFSEVHDRSQISGEYFERLKRITLKDKIEFFKSIGVMYKLEVDEINTNNNPKVRELRKDYYKAYVKWTGSAIDDDYNIHGLDTYLSKQSVNISRNVWLTIINAKKESATARFRPNRQYEVKTADSQLIYFLKIHAWIPDKSGVFCKPQDMTRDDLRTDFPYDDRNGILTAIGFGENAKKRSEDYQRKNNEAKNLGFSSVDQAAKWAELAALGVSPDDLITQFKRAEQPEDVVTNPERRRKGVLEQGENAPSKESVARERNIQPGARPETVLARAYLRLKYKNSENQLICQGCHIEMPFKVKGEYYFEAIQCVRGLEQHHFENRLALCPLCAAKYQHARDTEDTEIRRRIVEHDSPDNAAFVEIPVMLAGQKHNIRFVGTHWFDLRIVLDK